MTSPTDPPKQPITERITQRISFGGSDSVSDPEERFTRNVTILFVGLIIIAAVVVVFGLGYGYYDANLRPLANVGGTEIGRGEYEDRVALERFRLERAETAVRTGLADGTVNEDLANRRLTTIANAGAGVDIAALETLVDLRFKQQLAEEAGITLPDDEVAAALAADGSTPETRRVSALVITSDEEQLGLTATAEGLAQKQADAEAALGALEAGTPFAEVAAEYSPSTSALDGDLGYVELGDVPDPVWGDAIFALEEGGVSGIITGEGGELLIGMVTEIVPPQSDAGFLNAVADAVGDETHLRNIELEATAAKLEARIIDEALDKDYDQVKLAEILVRGETFLDPEEDEGSIRASHILYAPGDLQAEPLPADDPAWAEAEQKADLAAEQLRNLDDPRARENAFAVRAQHESDGPTGPNGGDLGYFERARMVPEFADAVFDAPDLVRGDIVGPVRSEFGWHVIMFNDRTAPLAERLAATEAALAAEGADFASVAREFSDGPEAVVGGETGWHVLDDLDDLSAIALAAVEIGEFTEPVDADLGYYIYLKQDEAEQPLEPEAASRLRQRVFEDWYQELRFDAEDEGRISIDESFYEASQAPLAPQNAPIAPGHGG